MISANLLCSRIDTGHYDHRLSALYALDGTHQSLSKARSRIHSIISGFLSTFSKDDSTPIALLSGPGRTEIGGNHTDHQHGCVLCASVDMDTLACVAPNGTDLIQIHSEGYPLLTVSIKDLEKKIEEENTSASLVRGVSAKILSMGYALSGFDAYMTSDVLAGSGLSSSAAYEVLMGNILNHLFCNDEICPIDIAKIGQYAENIYFGKPSGLMDQMGSAVGGAVAIDFNDPTTPVVTPVHFDFATAKHALCIVDTGSCHADLTDDYSEITYEMGAISSFFHKQVLRDIPEDQFYAAIPQLREKAGDRAVLRAIHFYEDNLRAQEEVSALLSGDFTKFLAIIADSGHSSAVNLQNTWSVATPHEQAIPLALSLGKRLLNGTGAIRVHGGGFAGTIQAFVPYDTLEAFKQGMESVLGLGNCHVLHIRPQGGCVVISE